MTPSQGCHRPGGFLPLPGAAHYAASKAVLEQLPRSWALELAGDGIRVNAPAPPRARL
ncbi:SDR family oxidoreductase [Nonomuraea sp. NPDC049655]|uniref:SDR family oxidoreductase n=1 Tax=Nonomuraea sp. NPDC049655 TaxID=3364355 RepID=UPI0037B23ABE